LLLPSLLLLSSLAAGQIREAKRILVIEDQMTAPAYEAVDRSFESNLLTQFPEAAEFYRESLDTILMPDLSYQTQVKAWYEHKYSHRKLDLIVTIGPASHDLIQREHARFFPGVPVVFCADLKTDGETRPDPDFTGVWIDFDPVGTVDAARHLLPAAKHVAVIAGNGLFDQLFLAQVRKRFQGYQGVDFTYVTDFDMASLLTKVRSLPEDTVILYLTVTKDRSGRRLFVTYTLPLVSAAADVPVFGMIDLMVDRQAIVGGHVSSLSAQGQIASDLAVRILQGSKPQELPVVTAPNRYAFGWTQLQRWGLDASLVPPGSAVLNRDPGIWQRYRRTILVIIGTLLFLAILVIYLLIERTKRLRVQRQLEHDIAERKKAEAALMDLSSRLIDAQEEERSRIARELHDDFNQRLAVLAINLQTATRIVPTEPDKAVARMNDLCEQTSDIGADLHKMSRNLHSSTLDVLGLAEGIRSLCDEVAEQQGLQVEFVAHEVPRTISRQTSLCLYRIAQEGLRNVTRHSGANEAVVQLHGNGRESVLSIADAGPGFDAEAPGFKPGLGLGACRSACGRWAAPSGSSRAPALEPRLPRARQYHEAIPIKAPS
jgi:signal transduction histidine kinase